MTDLSLHAICDSMCLTYLKIEGYKDCFTEGCLENVIEKMGGIETYIL